jgi:hypothetical protein
MAVVSITAVVAAVKGRNYGSEKART